MAKLHLIAALMTPNAVQSQLIPYLQSNFHSILASFITLSNVYFIAKLTDLDQVALHICTHIGNLVPFIGGPSQVQCLLPLIEPLCHLEETVIRNAITASVCKILTQLSPEHDEVLKAFFDMTQRLYEGDEESESFFGRVSVCFYIHELYHVTTDQDNRESIREIFSKLITDDFPMVRSSAAKILPSLAAFATKELLVGEFMHFQISLCTDENEAVKVAAVENLLGYAQLMLSKHTSMDERVEFVNTIRSASYDTSWKIRLAISRNLAFFAAFFPPDRVATDLLACGIALIQDSEIEVRSVAITNMAVFYSVSGSTFLTEFVPVAKLLMDDPQSIMRKGLADVCIDVAAQAGQEVAANYFNDTIIKLVSDADPMVRLRVLKKLPVIAEDIPSLCIRMVTSLRAFFSDSNWRTRAQLASSVPAIAKHLGKFSYPLKDRLMLMKITRCGLLLGSFPCGVFDDF